MAREPRRNADINPPTIHVVNPHGLVKPVQVASNIRGALELDDDGQPVLVRSYAKSGWAILRDLYEAEGRMDLWRAWEAYQEARAQAKKESRPVPKFEDRYLPREVHRRRAGHLPSATVWTMPDLPPVDMSDPVEDEVVQAPKAKGKRGSGGPAPAAAPALEV